MGITLVSERFFSETAMENPNAQGRMELLEQEVAKIREFVMGSGRDNLATVVKQIAKKQDKTERILATLMKGQAKLIEMGTHTDNNQRRGATQSRNMDQDWHSFEWVCRKESGQQQSQGEE